MTKYNPDIHHRRTIRLIRYNYSQEGLYFITICTQNHACLFGNIVGAYGIRPNENGVCPNENGIRPNDVDVCHTPQHTKMQLNAIGEIVKNEWEKTTQIRREIELHEYIIMPNHFHAIVEITVGAYGIRTNENGIRTNGADGADGDGADGDGGVCHTPLRSPSKTVGALVRGFKSSVTKRLGFSPWQRNYYEHIIRDEKSYQIISEYIQNNPEKWINDIFNPLNTKNF